MGYSGLKKRVILSGYGGNSILIDPETSTIVVINSLHATVFLKVKRLSLQHMLLKVISPVPRY